MANLYLNNVNFHHRLLLFSTISMEDWLPSTTSVGGTSLCSLCVTSWILWSHDKCV
jgi:hypothetical protein